MITVLVNHRVADYDDWKAAYDRIDSGPPSKRRTQLPNLARSR